MTYDSVFLGVPHSSTLLDDYLKNIKLCAPLLYDFACEFTLKSASLWPNVLFFSWTRSNCDSNSEILKHLFWFPWFWWNMLVKNLLYVRQYHRDLKGHFSPKFVTSGITTTRISILILKFVCFYFTKIQSWMTLCRLLVCLKFVNTWYAKVWSGFRATLSLRAVDLFQEICRKFLRNSCMANDFFWKQ